MSGQQIYQPLHPDVRPLLDPEYTAFHDKVLQYIVPSHTLPFNPSAREIPAPWASVPVKVGAVRDVEKGDWQARVWTPEGEKPAGGWPVLIWYHGGGWTLGGLGSENHVCAAMCKHASCVVVSVNYRHAPEHPYPAAVDDSVDALKWVYISGLIELDIDPSRIAVGGESAGGNLAAIVSLKAASLDSPIPLKFQLLAVPVTDNTATVSTIWKVNANAPWLTPDRMLWYRKMYLPNEEDCAKWDASPIYAPQDLLARTPKAWVGLAELDLLRPEGEAYGEMLRKAGVETEIKVYKGATHSIVTLDGGRCLACLADGLQGTPSPCPPNVFFPLVIIFNYFASWKINSHLPYTNRNYDCIMSGITHTASTSYANSGFSNILGWGSHPALLIIDVCKAYWTEGSPLDISSNPAGAAAPDSMRALLRAARTGNVPVFWSTVEYTHPEMADAGLFYHKAKVLTIWQKGDPRRLHEYLDGLEPAEKDEVVVKKYASAFFGTSLASALRVAGVDTVVICGVSTSGCVRATTLDALQHGFRPMVVGSACGDRTPEIQNSNLFDLHAKYADVVSEGEAVEKLRANV
ncbi:hypothetical protein EW146_g1635 [Bondarzewia mesenterica]|uniref:Alpha/beta hydrolase fold-3 domain-containing protein n=1 Tax=Bondarzewia mesenterica TaxID=1095465 RepID=A0A4V6S1J9_9AGAM|nr:hypothetical protein EW146_g1635 [Bondarzewia mesenterica]